MSSGAADPSRPDVGTLSALRLKGSGEEFDEEDKERQLFGEAAEGEGSSGGGGAPAVALRSLLLSLPGIEERLGDAAAASPSVHAGEEGTLEIFLRRSEAVVAELMQAVDQHHRRIRREGVDLGRKRRRTGAGGEAAALEEQARAAEAAAGVPPALSAPPCCCSSPSSSGWRGSDPWTSRTACPG